MDDEYEDWDVEPIPPAYCDMYVVEEPHTYTAINGNVYSCPGLTQDELDKLHEEAEAEPCEHGLSATLCGGPMHWYD